MLLCSGKYVKDSWKKYGVEYDGFGKPAPEDSEEELKQFKNNIDIALSVLRNDRELGGIHHR